MASPLARMGAMDLEPGTGEKPKGAQLWSRLKTKTHTMQAIGRRRIVRTDVEEPIPLRLAALTCDSPHEQLLRKVITLACREEHVEPEWVTIKTLKDGVTKHLDAFSNADIVLVDKSCSTHRPFLSFQLGLRDSISSKPSIVAFHDSGLEDADRLISTRFHCAPYKAVIRVLGDHEHEDLVLGSHGRDDGALGDYIVSIIHSYRESMPRVSTKDKRFHDGLKRAQSTELSKADRRSELKALELMLQHDPHMVTRARLYDLLLTYRDLKEWNDIIRLINYAGNSKAAKLPQIQYFVAFALNRRSLEQDNPRDRQRALGICERVCAENRELIDAWGLKGRIYKDMFIESINTGGIKDYASCEAAIEAYEVVYNQDESFYGAVNLVTLLFASEHFEDRQSKIESICSKMLESIARRGGVMKSRDYWEMASFFESNVVAGLFFLANQAAPMMYSLATDNWMLETTMRNIQLIDKLRKLRESSAVGGTVDEVVSMSRSDPERIAFEFWSEFFLQASKSEADLNAVVRMPALILSTGEPRQCHVMVHPETNRDECSVEIVEVLHDVSKKFPMSKITSLVPMDIEFPHKQENSDKRRISLTVFHKNFSAFSLHFSSQEQRDHFYSLCLEGGCEANEVTEEAQTMEAFDWEFNLMDGERIHLGTGATAVVYAGINCETEEEIAIKEVQVDDDRGVPVELREEIRTIRHLQHKNIVKFLHCESGHGVFRLMMELVPGGSLTSLLYKWGPILGRSEVIVDYTTQLLEALAYLHGSDIIHRDVKGDNVLINMYSGVLKLADFGTSKRMAGLNPRTDTLAGTPWYMAPEVIQSDTHDYGRESDIWSLGCTVWQMAMGRPPLVEIRDPNEVMETVGIYQEHAPIPPTWDDKIKGFLHRCFVIEPRERASAEALLSDPLLIKTPETPLAPPESPSAGSWMRQLSLTRETSVNGTPMESWLLPQSHQDIADATLTLIEKESDRVVQAWHALMEEDGSFHKQDIYKPEVLEKLLTVLIDIIRTQSSIAARVDDNQMYQKITHALPEIDFQAMDSMDVLILIKTLTSIKSPSSGHGRCWVADLLQDDSFKPHWIFEIELFFGKAIEQFIEQVAKVVGRRTQGDRRKEFMKSRLRSRSRANSAAAGLILDGSEGGSVAGGIRHSSSYAPGLETVLRGSLASLGVPIVTVQPDPVNVDEKLKAFVQSAGLPDSVTVRLAKEYITLEVLTQHMTKEDVKDVGLPIGYRCVLWRAVERYGKRRNSMSS